MWAGLFYFFKHIVFGLLRSFNVISKDVRQTKNVNELVMEKPIHRRASRFHINIYYFNCKYNIIHENVKREQFFPVFFYDRQVYMMRQASVSLSHRHSPER